MKKVLFLFLSIIIYITSQAQITVTIGSAMLQDPGTDVHLPVTVTGLNGQSGGIGVTGIELHISYTNTYIVYDTTLNFCSLTPVTQWDFSGNGIEYATIWMEPSLNKLNIPDNTVLFDIVFHYLGGLTELNFDTTRCLLLDSAYSIIQGVQYIKGQITPSQGSGESRWNGTGSWNTIANWSNGIPGDSTNAIIESGEVTILSNAVCRSLTINLGTTINLSSNFALTANGNYTNNGTLKLKSDATGSGSLIVRGSVTGAGLNDFGRYLDFASGSSHLVSSPVTGTTAFIFGSNTVEKYIESSASWLAMATSENLETGSGYRISGSTPTTFTFQGLFNTSDMTWSNLAYTGSGQTETRGLNLLGNPYPSAIQWEQGNWSRTNLDYAVYVWDEYKYISWNGTIGALKDGIIPAMQGFFVKSNASGASLTIPAGSRLHNTQPFYKSANEVSQMISMKIESTNDTSHYDETFVNILSGSSAGYDGNYDAVKLYVNSAYPQIYTKAADQSQLSINTQPDFASVPVECKVGVAGSYKITFGNMESFNADQPLYFEDTTSNTTFNIRSVNEYVFSSEVTTEPGRFVLHFQEVGMDEQAESAFNIWNTGNVIRITPKAGNDQIDRLDIYSITGQLIYSTMNLELPATIQQENLVNGLYILKIKTNKGVYAQKLLVR